MVSSGFFFPFHMYIFKRYSFTSPRSHLYHTYHHLSFLSAFSSSGSRSRPASSRTRGFLERAWRHIRVQAVSGRGRGKGDERRGERDNSVMGDGAPRAEALPLDQCLSKPALSRAPAAPKSFDPRHYSLPPSTPAEENTKRHERRNPPSTLYNTLPPRKIPLLLTSPIPTPSPEGPSSLPPALPSPLPLQHTYRQREKRP